MDTSNSMFLGGLGEMDAAQKAQQAAVAAAAAAFGFPMMDFTAPPMGFNPFALQLPGFVNGLPPLSGPPSFGPFATPFFDLSMASAAMMMPGVPALEPLMVAPSSPALSSSSMGSPVAPLDVFAPLSPNFDSPSASITGSPLTSSASTPSSPSPPSSAVATPGPAVPRFPSSGAAGAAKKKKKRKPKPRMSELPMTEAQAKRDSNRESARKCRERKREREQAALDENEILHKEIAELKLKVQVLTSLLLEKDAVAAGSMVKRQRLE